MRSVAFALVFGALCAAVGCDNEPVGHGGLPGDNPRVVPKDAAADATDAEPGGDDGALDDSSGDLDTTGE